MEVSFGIAPSLSEFNKDLKLELIDMNSCYKCKLKMIKNFIANLEGIDNGEYSYELLDQDEFKVEEALWNK